MKYKVGDKVRIKKDLKAQRYGIEFVVDGMLKYAGHPATITKVMECHEGIKYSIDISSWNWTEEMFEDSTTSTVETIADCDFKIGDKVIFKPTEKDKLLGVLTISDIDTCLGVPCIGLEGHDVWFKPNRFLKVPLFKVGQIVQFHNIKDDKWCSETPNMANIEGRCGIITKVTENRYVANKQHQDGCTYKVKDIQNGEEWLVTSASLEPIPTVSELKDVTSVIQDKGLTTDIGITTTTAEAIAQAVDNVKGPQFKIGDKVLIREDLIPGKTYDEWKYNNNDGWFINPEMKEYFGKVAKVTHYSEDDPHYCRLDIDKGYWSWIQDSLLHYTPGSDYDLDKQINQQTKQNYENQLQGKEEPLIGGCECTGTGVCYPGEQATACIGHLGYRKITYKC